MLEGAWIVAKSLHSELDDIGLHIDISMYNPAVEEPLTEAELIHKMMVNQIQLQTQRKIDDQIADDAESKDSEEDAQLRFLLTQDKQTQTQFTASQQAKAKIRDIQDAHTEVQSLVRHVIHNFCEDDFDREVVVEAFIDALDEPTLKILQYLCESVVREKLLSENESENSDENTTVLESLEQSIMEADQETKEFLKSLQTLDGYKFFNKKMQDLLQIILIQGDWNQNATSPLRLRRIW
eukprot:TRINITY_DN10621_c3_g1_i2.p2 TRINITY_DN10621_c3_g1~~TRINITY_DN10621_c3_g1_i2.p2  ORF type:complete len:251 (-),score=39.78 TRINITY_DN10621_c3_g1_i2:25-738(-)